MQQKKNPTKTDLCLRVLLCLPLIVLIAVITPLAFIEELYARQKS